MPTFPPYTQAERERLEARHPGGHRLDRLVPFHRQHLDVTCGPAALMMALAYFDPDTPLDRDLEMRIWREANLVEVWGTSREGLAVAAATRGFEASTQGNPAGTSFVDAIRDQLPEVNQEALELFYEDTRDRFDRLDLTDVPRRVEPGDLERALDAGRLPVILTDGARLHAGEAPIPHWVLVRGYTPEDWILNDPDAGEPGTRFPRGQDLVGYGPITCAVYVGTHTRNRRRPHPAGQATR